MTISSQLCNFSVDLDRQMDVDPGWNVDDELEFDCLSVQHSGVERLGKAERTDKEILS